MWADVDDLCAWVVLGGCGAGSQWVGGGWVRGERVKARIKEFTICIGVTDPRGVPYGERLGPIKVKIIIEKRCFADLNNITTT